MSFGTVLSATIASIMLSTGLLIAGYPVWLVLVVYSAGGMFCVLFLSLWIWLRETPEAADAKESTHSWSNGSDSSDPSIGDDEFVYVRQAKIAD